MKCLFIAPLRYPFIHSIQSGMEAQGMEIKAVDYQDFFSARTNRWYNNYTSLPKKIRNIWEEPYVRKTNAEYLKIFQAFQPDLVFIYNNQLVLPDLLEQFRKTARIAFMLGDNPLYTPTSIYNLHILFQADYVISPDTMWRDQLARLGIKNVIFDCFGFNSATYFPMEVSAAERQQFQSDLIYVGSASKTNWGYKRMLFLSLFKELDLKAYISGGGMERWNSFFPGLEKRIIPHDRFDAGFNNLVYNCSKIAPVEQVPSLFNGIHVRVFDILGAGILPLCEYSADLEMVFAGIDLPQIKNYPEGSEMARFWLDNEDKRTALVQQLRERVLERYTPAMVIRRMTEHLF
ncbi:MAG: glycosyltransferase [Lewinellaceae bacterium]|nr:glycosyltransferase [Lewinellaceae bacterium]